MLNYRRILNPTGILVLLLLTFLPAPAHAAELPIPGKTNIGLVKYAYKAVNEGWGYILGASGQVLTESRLQYFMNNNPDQYDTEDRMEQAYAWLDKRVADCSGLIRAYLYADEDSRSVQTSDYPFLTSMSSVWYGSTPNAERGPIETMPETLGIILHRQNHVAIYIGHGKIIEAKGLRHGVVISDMIPAEWETWVKPNCIDYLDAGFYNIGDTVYYIQNGLITTGWITDSLGNIYYVDTEGNTFTGVRNINGTNFLFSESGICYGVYTDDGLVFNDGNYYYYRAGEKQTGWFQFEDKSFYFDPEDGKQCRATAKLIGGRAYLFLEDGSVNKAAGSVFCDGYTYQCSHNGEPMRGYIDGVFYGENFLPCTEFISIGNNLYYFRDGYPVEPGFNLIEDEWYYVQDDGTIATGSIVLNGRTYNCGNDGKVKIGEEDSNVSA